jgi:hypothetical protein
MKARPVRAFFLGDDMTHSAIGTFDIQMKPAPAGEGVGRVAVGRMLIDKTYKGALVATAQGEFLSAGNPAAGSAAYVAVEHVTGTLDGREGSFALVHSGTMHAGESVLSIKVAPGSGTGALAGISGTLKLDIVERVHHYTLSYSLPDA